MDLVIEVYAIIKLFPHEEQFGLISQMRRAVISIPSNIAEGKFRQTAKKYVRFLFIALGSKSEVETQLEICFRLKYISEEQSKVALGLCEEVGKILNRMIINLKPKT